MATEVDDRLVQGWCPVCQTMVLTTPSMWRCFCGRELRPGWEVSLCRCGCGQPLSFPLPKVLRPSTSDGRSLPCVRCGFNTPDAMFYGGDPMCDNCGSVHGREQEDPPPSVP